MKSSLKRGYISEELLVIDNISTVLIFGKIFFYVSMNDGLFTGTNYVQCFGSLINIPYTLRYKKSET